MTSSYSSRYSNTILILASQIPGEDYDLEVSKASIN